MKTGKLAMTGAMVLALALGVMPVQGKEVKTDTAPEMYRTCLLYTSRAHETKANLG